VRDLAQLVARKTLVDDHQVGYAEDARLAVTQGHGDAAGFLNWVAEHIRRAGAGVAQRAVRIGGQHRVGDQVARDDVCADAHHAKEAGWRVQRSRRRGEPMLDQRDGSRYMGSLYEMDAISKRCPSYAFRPLVL
jgi:hypothetical protein